MLYTESFRDGFVIFARFTPAMKFQMWINKQELYLLKIYEPWLLLHCPVLDFTGFPDTIWLEIISQSDSSLE